MFYHNAQATNVHVVINPLKMTEKMSTYKTLYPLKSRNNVHETQNKNSFVFEQKMGVYVASQGEKHTPLKLK